MEDTFHDAEISKTIPGEPVVFQLYGSVRLPAAPLISITLFSTITRQRQEIDKNISALAAYVASMDSVVSMLENGYPDGSANEALDSCLKIFPISMS